MIVAIKFKLSFFIFIYCTYLFGQNQNTLFVGTQLGINFTKCRLEDKSVKYITTPINEGLLIGIPLEFGYKNKYLIETGINRVYKVVSVKNTYPIDTAGYQKFATVIETWEVPLKFGYRYKLNNQNFLDLKCGITVDFNYVWKKGKAPGERVDSTNTLEESGSGSETRINSTSNFSIGFGHVYSKGYRLQINLIYAQGFSNVQTFYTNFIRDSKLLRTPYNYDGSYLAVVVGLTYDFNRIKNQMVKSPVVIP